MYITPPTSTIPEPWVWLKSDKSSSMVLKNSITCSAWNDWRGYASGVTSSAGRAPFYTGSGYLGYPAIRFPMMADTSFTSYFEITSSSRIHDIFSGSTGHTIAMAYYCDRTLSSPTGNPLMAEAVNDVSAGIAWNASGQVTFRPAITGSDGTVAAVSATILATSTQLTSSVFGFGVCAVSCSAIKKTTGVTGSIWINTAFAATKNKNFLLSNITASRNFGNHAYQFKSSDVIGLYPSAPIRIGLTDPTTPSTRYFVGEIYELMFWDRPLSEGEIGTVMRYFEKWR
jgi:hypothetical protein